MTFKHNDLSSSPVMRSFERIAREKGMIKDEPIQKTASNKNEDLSASSDLMQNIIKLCNGLRVAGFNKYADELTNNYLNYKQANTSCYDVSGETGEDLVNAAHPKGSHKLEDVAGDDLAVIETILDKHLKIVDVVNKKPTGKLASSGDIVNAVKKSLGAPTAASPFPITGEPVNINDLYKQLNDNFRKFRQIYSSLAIKLGEGTDYNDRFLNAIQNIITNKRVYHDPKVENYLVNTLNGFKEDKEPGTFSTGNEATIWKSEILPLIGVANKYANNFRNIVSDIRKLEEEAKTSSVLKENNLEETETKPNASTDSKPAAPTTTETQKVLQGYDTAIANTELYEAKINAKGLPNAAELVAWLKKARETFLIKFKGDLSASKYNTDPDILKEYTQKLNSINSKLDAFNQKWIVNQVGS